MAKIYRVIQMKLNQLVCENVRVISQQSVFKRYRSDKHFLGVLPTRRRQKSAGIHMERNYAILCTRHRLWSKGQQDLTTRRILKLAQREAAPGAMSAAYNCFVLTVVRRLQSLENTSYLSASLPV